jgi:hypothetical protein
MNYSGKKYIYVSKQTANGFSGDPIRQIICKSDSSYNFSLKDNVKIVDNSESYNQQRKLYEGMIEISADDEIILAVTQAIEDSIPSKTKIEFTRFITALNDINSKEDIKILRNQFIDLVRESDIIRERLEKIFGGSEEELRGFLKKDEKLEILREFVNEGIFSDLVLENLDNLGRPAIYNIINNDFNFILDKHYEQKKEINKNNNLKNRENIFRFNADFIYNFYVKNYEDFLNERENENLSELNLPYFYEILEYKNGLANSPNLSDYDGVQGTQIIYKDYPSTTFFNKPKQIIDTSTPRDILKKLIINSKLGESIHSLIPINKYLNNFNSFKELFPFYVDLSFNTHEIPREGLCNLLHTYNVYSELLQDISDSLSLSNDRIYEKYENSEKFINTNFYILEERFIARLFKKYVNNNVSFYFLLNSRLDKLKRNFKEILEGKKSHYEVVAYQIEKYENNNNTPIQEWYLPNISEGTLNWIDSQVKYNKKYTYKINLITLVVGNAYKYIDIRKTRSGIKIRYENFPQFYIYKIKNSATYTSAIVDNPPVPPDLEIVPFVGVDNKIKLNLNTGIGSFYTMPIEFNDTEKNNNINILAAQDRADSEGKIFYNSDEPSKFFEIFKINVKPKSYLDFKNFKLNTISTNGNTAATFIDTIEPNKKYYYIARSIDNHNGISNPTYVYEVEIFNENGAIYPIVNIVDFDKGENLKQSSKSFRRYIKISPSFAQTIASKENITIDKVALGTNENTIWTKNMKIRITSKQTGRKIDLNFRFIYDIIKN